MGTDLAKPANLGELLRERVQAALVDLITPEQWGALLTEEWNKLLVDRVEPKTWTFGENKHIPAAIKHMIANELQAQVGERVKPLVRDHLDRLGTEMWEATAVGVMSAMIEEVARATMAQWKTNLIQEVVMNIQCRRP